MQPTDTGGGESSNADVMVDAYKIESSTCEGFAETTACTYHKIILAADTLGSLDHILDRSNWIVPSLRWLEPFTTSE